MSLSTPSAVTSPGVNLGVVVALPILGFVVILIALAGCCFFFIRWRRKRVRRNRYQSHLYDRWNDTTISTPKQSPNGWAWADPNVQGGYTDTSHQMHAAAAGYGYGPGFGFVDNDGRSHEVGYGHDYSKTAFQQEITETPPSAHQHGTVSDPQGFEPNQKQAL